MLQTVGDIDIYYEQEGTGDDILFLHGLGSCIPDWEKQIGPFAERYRVTAVELRGHGRSSKPYGPYHIREFAQDVGMFLTRIGIERTHVVGLSMGGMVGQYLAVLFPSVVRSLVLANTVSAVRPDNPKDRVQLMIRKAIFPFVNMETISQKIADKLFPDPNHAEWHQTFRERLAKNDRTAYLSITKAALSHDAGRIVGDINCPTLVIAGEKDTTVPLRYQQALRNGIAGAEMIVLPNAGHAAPVDAADEFNRAIFEFLERL